MWVEVVVVLTGQVLVGWGVWMAVEWRVQVLEMRLSAKLDAVGVVAPKTGVYVMGEREMAAVEREQRQGSVDRAMSREGRLAAGWRRSSGR